MMHTATMNMSCKWNMAPILFLRSYEIMIKGAKLPIITFIAGFIERLIKEQFWR